MLTAQRMFCSETGIIESEIVCITSKTLAKVFRSFEERLVSCLDDDGGHLEDVM